MLKKGNGNVMLDASHAHNETQTVQSNIHDIQRASSLLNMNSRTCAVSWLSKTQMMKKGELENAGRCTTCKKLTSACIMFPDLNVEEREWECDVRFITCTQ